MKLSMIVTVLGVSLCACSSAPPSSEWPTYHHNAGGTHFSPLKQITPANVAQLQPAWTYHMRPASTAAEAPPAEIGDAPPTRRGRLAVSEATPLVADRRMFLATPYGRVVALDPESGRELWAYALANNDQPSMRGVEYWPGME